MTYSEAVAPFVLFLTVLAVYIQQLSVKVIGSTEKAGLHRVLMGEDLLYLSGPQVNGEKHRIVAGAKVIEVFYKEGLSAAHSTAEALLSRTRAFTGLQQVIAPPLDVLSGHSGLTLLSELSHVLKGRLHKLLYGFVAVFRRLAGRQTGAEVQLSQMRGVYLHRRRVLGDVEIEFHSCEVLLGELQETAFFRGISGQCSISRELLLGAVIIFLIRTAAQREAGSQ